jgi:hypothetical protein
MKDNMLASELYPSRFLEAADLQGHKPTVMIADVELEELELQGKKGTEKKNCAVITLADPKTKEPKKKQFLANRTNTYSLALLLGRKVKDWQWKRIVLCSDDEVDPSSGDPICAIRIESSPDAAPERAKAYATAWGGGGGKRQRGALARRLKKAINLIDGKKQPETTKQESAAPPMADQTLPADPPPVPAGDAPGGQP